MDYESSSTMKEAPREKLVDTGIAKDHEAHALVATLLRHSGKGTQS